MGMTDCLKKILQLFTLGSALWLVGDMVLDGMQTSKYYHFSPYLNPNHEANLNMSERMLTFCTTFEEIKYNQTMLTKPENDLHDEWRERCQTGDFNFSISFGLFEEQTESSKVSVTWSAA